MSRTARVCAIIAVIASLLPAPVRAHSAPGGTAVTWKALPCPLWCTAYWTTEYPNPCEPFPPNYGFDDHITPPAPEAPPGKVTILRVVLYNEVDWDLYVCANGGWRDQLAQGGTHLGEPCDTILGPDTSIIVGCHEDASTPVRAGQTVILRAYNWLDVFPAHGRYWFEFV